MKTPFFAALLFSIAANIQGQNALYPITTNQSGSTLVQDTPYAIVNRDANSRVWERTTYEQGPSGETVPHLHRYTEMATGLNYQKDGQWVDSKEEIDILPTGGAAATQGQNQVYFPSDIYNGEIRMVTLASNVLRSRPMGLSYDDGTNTVLISELKDSVGQLVGSNQVIYPDAFTGFKADLLFTYTRSGFEQDIVLREAPRTPESYGLNAATARLQVLTEFFSPPQPTIISSVLPSPAGLALTDQTLDFGDTAMIRGRAFLLGADPTDQPVPVSKQWLLLDGRQFLVEEVPVDEIVQGLAALPQVAMNSSSVKTPHVASRRLALPPQRLAKKDSSKAMMLAKNELPTSGFVLDYQTVNGSLTNFTFQGDTTYYVSGQLTLLGTNTVEGGTVIKFTNSSSSYLKVGGLGQPSFLLSETGPYRMAAFTSMNDNSVGETITGSSGSPTNTGVAYLELFYDTSTSSNTTLSYLRFAYAGMAIAQVSEGTAYTNICPIWNCQFVNCGNAIGLSDYDNLNVLDQRLYNVLFANCGTAVTNWDIYYSGQIAISGQNVTADQVNILLGTWSGDSYATNYSRLTNCILTAVGHQIYFEDNGIGTSISTNACFVSASSTGIYQIAGAGSYYLTNGSSCRNAGTTNIDASLLTELQQKTTYPPAIYSNTTFSVDTEFNAEAQRDTDTPDLGYHYDPIDYLVDTCWITNATLSVDAGVVIAGYNDPGIVVTDGSAINSVGTPLAPVWFTKYSCVQEQPVEIGSTPDQGGALNSWHSSTAPNGYYRFSKFSCLAGGGLLLYHNSNWAYRNLLVEDCEFWGGKNDFTGTSSSTAVLKNNLFVRSLVSTSSSGYSNNSLIASNNLFWNMTFVVQSGINASNWCFFNNDFNNTAITGMGSHPAVNGYNGYIGNTNRLSPVGLTDVVSTNAISYQSGPLGYFYQPANCILANTGSVTADLTGLYHYTTTTNQVKETNSVVDIGYHYIAVDGNGNPIDTDGDGNPDYLEDANGNGVVDSGETDWQNASDLGLKVLITRPRNNSIIP